MKRRHKLHKILKDILGSENVYFQPPESVKMKYPAIVYLRSNERIIHADNIPYKRVKRYQITVITKDPDSDIPDKIGELSGASFNRFFTSEGLNHDVYTLYF